MIGLEEIIGLLITDYGVLTTIGWAIAVFNWWELRSMTRRERIDRENMIRELTATIQRNTQAMEKTNEIVVDSHKQMSIQSQRVDETLGKVMEFVMEVVKHHQSVTAA